MLPVISPIFLNIKSFIVTAMKRVLFFSPRYLKMILEFYFLVLMRYTRLLNYTIALVSR